MAEGLHHLSDDVLSHLAATNLDLEDLRSLRACSKRLAKISRAVVCDAAWLTASITNEIDLSCAQWREGSYDIAMLTASGGTSLTGVSSRAARSVTAVACSAGLVFSCTGAGVHLWQAHTDAFIGSMRLPTEHSSAVLRHLAVDGSFLACSEGMDHREGHTERRKLFCKREVPNGQDGGSNAVSSPSSFTLDAVQWQPPTGNAAITGLAWHPAGAPRLIAAAVGPFYPGERYPGGFLACLKDVSVGWTPSDRILAGHTELITSVSVDKERDLVASSSIDGTVRLWDVWESGRCADIIGKAPSVASHSGRAVYAVDAGGGLIASFVAPRTVKIWDPRTVKIAIDGLVPPPPPHVSRVTHQPVCLNTLKCGTHEIRRTQSTNFDGAGLLSLDGTRRLLACASANGPRLWDLRKPSSHLAELLDDASPVTALAFAAGASDRRLVTGCAKGEVQVYEPLR